MSKARSSLIIFLLIIGLVAQLGFSSQGILSFEAAKENETSKTARFEIRQESRPLHAFQGVELPTTVNLLHSFSCFFVSVNATSPIYLLGFSYQLFNHSPPFPL